MSQIPVNVSPVIKFSRYAMLTAGLFYGLLNHKRLSIKENKYRKEEERKKAIRDAHLAEEKRIAREEEMQALAILSKKRGGKH